jgi:DNA-binding transcriptional LysR family regulator
MMEKTGVTQKVSTKNLTTSSQQIKSLQKECGIKLYKVNTGNLGIELTQAGRLLLKHAKLILLQVKILEKKLISSRRRRGGHR